LIDTANAPIFGIDNYESTNGTKNPRNYRLLATKPSNVFVDTFIVPSLRKTVHEVFDNALKGQGT
jgi:hypothetical protein